MNVQLSMLRVWLLNFFCIVGSFSQGLVVAELDTGSPSQGVCMLQTQRAMRKISSSRLDAPSPFHEGPDAPSADPGILSAMLIPCCLSSGVWVILLSMLDCLKREEVASPREAAVSCMMGLQFVGMLTYSLPILHSLDLATAVARDAAWSGQMVGVFALGIMFGGCIIWMFLICWPQLWRRWTRTVLLTGLACSIVGVLLFLSTVLILETGRQNHSAALLLVAARFISGVGQGINAQFNITTLARLTAATERPSRMTTFLFANMMGVGIGPIVAAGVQALQPARPGFALLAWVNLLFLFGMLFWLCRRLPLLEEVPDLLQADANQLMYKISENGFLRQRIVITGCLMMGGLRGYIVAALEVASAMLFEHSFHWDLRFVGVMIALVFLCCAPVKVLYAIHKDRLTTVSWIRCFCCLPLCGTVLLSRANTGSGAMLMLADVLTFPTIYLAEGLALGVLQQNLLPDGSHFADANTSMLYRMLLTNGVGRFCGPWIARWCIQVGGLNLYFKSQLAAILCFWLIFECVVKPHMLAQCASKM